MPLTNHPNYATFEAERQLVFSKATTAEANYLGAAARYLQGLLVPTTTADGSIRSPVDLDHRPSDEPQGWRALGMTTTTRQVYLQYWIDRYDGPSGSAYAIGARCVWGGSEWRYMDAAPFHPSDFPLRTWIERPWPLKGE